MPNDMQEAVALAHLSVATGSGDDDEEVSIPWPGVSDGMPRLLPVPSAWWETPAVTTRALSARPEEARTARRYNTEDVRMALDLEPELPIVLCDARSKESAKDVLIALVEHVLVTASEEPLSGIA